MSCYWGSVQAKDLLLTLLAMDPMKVDEIEEAFEANGISWRTANTAKKDLGIDARRIGGREGHYVWQLPSKGCFQ